nr:hypothetical protein [Parabacteroides goldsteinii]
MKLKQLFGDAGQKTKAAPTVSVCFWNGAFRFNKATFEILGLKKGDGLVFFQDEDNPTDWYFKKSTSRGSIQLKAQGNTLYVYSTSIARPLLASRKISQESARFYLSDAQQVCGQGYWKIQTENVK